MTSETNRCLCRDTAASARPVVLLGILFAVAISVLAAVVFLRPRAATTGLEAPSGAASGAATAGAGAQPANPLAAQLSASTGRTAIRGTTAFPVAEAPVPVKDLITALKDDSLPISEHRAAIQALAELGSPEAVGALTELLNDSLRSVDLRSEAAAGLGDINGPEAMHALAQAAMTIGDEDVVTQVLSAIGRRDFSETQAFFRQYLGSGVASDLRVAAVESLAQAKGDPIAFLANYISDPDASVRASAAWAMSATEATGNAGPQLIASLQGEQDPEVRWRLYQALANQGSFDTRTALVLVQRETDPAARIAGMDLLGSSLRDNPTPAVRTFFDQTAAPALENTALTGESNSERMAAVMALVHASTPTAMSALQDLAQQATDPRVQQSAAKIVANPPPSMPKPSH
jgi:HEAT repeat protein